MRHSAAPSKAWVVARFDSSTGAANLEKAPQELSPINGSSYVLQVYPNHTTLTFEWDDLADYAREARLVLDGARRLGAVIVQRCPEEEWLPEEATVRCPALSGRTESGPFTCER